LWIEGLKFTTAIVNTGGETLKLLNDPGGPLSSLGWSPDGRTGAVGAATADTARTTGETRGEEGSFAAKVVGAVDKPTIMRPQCWKSLPFK